MVLIIVMTKGSNQISHVATKLPCFSDLLEPGSLPQSYFNFHDLDTFADYRPTSFYKYLSTLFGPMFACDWT